MAKTLNLIIVDDLALVKPLAERLGFKEGAWCLTDPLWGSQEGITSTLLRETRHTEEQISNDQLFYFVASTESVQHARGIGGYPHPSFAFEAAGLPRQLDVEFDRIMLATGYERWVIKERHSHFEGWHKHHNESRLMPLPEGGHVKINDEDPNVDPRFRFPSHRVSMKEPHEPSQPISPGVLTMKPEYAFASYAPDPNRPRWNWVLVDDVARLDEWAERLNILNFKPLSDEVSRGVSGLENGMDLAKLRSANVAGIHHRLTENTTFYTIVPEEILKAALISLDYSEAMRREAGLPSSVYFLPNNAALITKDYFSAIRDKRGDGWSLHNKSVAPEAKNHIIEEAYQFAVRTLGMSDLPQTYNDCKVTSPIRLHRGPATTNNEEWMRRQLDGVGKLEAREFFNQWTVLDNSFLGADAIKRLRENPSLGEKGSFSRDLFTETQLKQMQDMIPDIFLPDGTIDIAVMSKFYESKSVFTAPGLQRRSLHRLRTLGDIIPDSTRKLIDDMSGSGLVVMGRPHVYEPGQSTIEEQLSDIATKVWGDKPPLPLEVLKTINDYIDGMKDKTIPAFDDIVCTTDDGYTLNVTVTTRDPFIADAFRKMGGKDVVGNNNNVMAESCPLGRGLTPDATQRLWREQNPHIFADVGSYLTTTKHDPVGNIHNLGGKSNAED